MTTGARAAVAQKAVKKAYGEAPRPWQADAVAKAAEQFENRVMLIDHPRGSGKTREIAMQASFAMGSSGLGAAAARANAADGLLAPPLVLPPVVPAPVGQQDLLAQQPPGSWSPEKTKLDSTLEGPGIDEELRSMQSRTHATNENRRSTIAAKKLSVAALHIDLIYQ